MSTYYTIMSMIDGFESFINLAVMECQTACMRLQILLLVAALLIMVFSWLLLLL